jgi:hypothetical protein
MFVIYLYTEFHILLLDILSYSLREGYLSTYILNIRCHRIPVVKKLVGLDVRTKTGFPYVLTLTKVVVLSTVNLKSIDQPRPSISWGNSRFQWTKSPPFVDVVRVLFEVTRIKHKNISPYDYVTSPKHIESETTINGYQNQNDRLANKAWI